jgi:hypothetical protein
MKSEIRKIKKSKNSKTRLLLKPNCSQLKIANLMNLFHKLKPLKKWNRRCGTLPRSSKNLRMHAMPALNKKSRSLEVSFKRNVLLRSQ